ncbi:MAG: ATP-binding protein [Elusimicrobiaceae bacterium]|nr:ATP-binding protein [Elusimicrobiaceae bacterium]
MNNQDYKALYYIDKIIKNHMDESDSYEISRWIRRTKIVDISHLKKEEGTSDVDAFYKVRKDLGKISQLYNKDIKNTEEKNIETLAQVFNLTKEETEILSILYLLYKNKIFEDFVFATQHLRSRRLDNNAINACFKTNINKFLRKTSTLSSLGLIIPQYGDCAISAYAVDIINGKRKTAQNIINIVLGKKLSADLKAKDFAYIPELDFALKILKNPLSKGINILLYGAPGNGKTGFAKMLADEINKDLYPIGESNKVEEEENYRLQALYRSLKVVNKNTGCFLLFDEAEDIFSNGNTKCNKVQLNRLLEENPCPVIWCTNHIEFMDRAFVRRFTLAINFKTPPVEIRQKIWNKYLKQNKISAKEGEVLSLAKDYIIPPSMIAGAASAAKMIKGNIKNVKEHIDIMQQALNNGYKKPAEKKRKTDFCPALLNTDLDLEQLKNQLVGLGKLNFSLCLYGASGTGKSAYARYLAEALNINFCPKRASDLISPYVGRTEQNIAMAFAQTKEEKSLLIFDEADSFLQDRAQARYSWEKTAVNEMLTWMESHPYPFICTTNLMDNLDPASLRRFTFKVKYDFLTKAQIKTAFKFFFNMEVKEEDILCLNKITPADFALIKSKAEILGLKNQVPTLIRMLLAEQNLKSKTQEHLIGFTA